MSLHYQLVSNISEQPLTPFVKFIVGNEDLSNLPPQYIKSFEVTSALGTEGNHLLEFNVIFFDPHWDEIEYLLTNNWENLYFTYGYVGGVQSAVYKATATVFNTTFTPAGTQITLSGTGISTNAIFDSVTMDTETLNPTEAAKAICKKKGYKVLDSNFDPSNDITLSSNESFTVIDESSTSYIAHKLAPLAVDPSTGRGGFRFYLDDRTQPPTAYFKHTSPVTDGVFRTYIYGKGINSTVISFSADTGTNTVVTSSSYIPSGLTTTFIDIDSKEEVSMSAAFESTGDTQSEDTKVVDVIDASGSNYSMMQAKLRYRVYSLYGHSATLTILGDPTIMVADEFVNVLVITDKGNLHPTSGTYLVIGSTTSIQNGSMTTVLELANRISITDDMVLSSYRIDNATDRIPTSSSDVQVPGVLNEMTICTFNVNNANYKKGTPHIISTIIEEADIVGIQEITKEGASKIASESGLKHYMCETTSNKGHAVLYNYPINLMGAQMKGDLGGSGEKRKFFYQEFGNISLYHTQLHDKKDANSSQLDTLVNIIKKNTNKKAVVLLGDFNREDFKKLTDLGFKQVNTGQSINATEGGKSTVALSDQIFIKGAAILDVWKYEAIEHEYSDHDALFVKIRVS